MGMSAGSWEEGFPSCVGVLEGFTPFVSLLHSTSTFPVGVTVDLHWGIFIYYP